MSCEFARNEEHHIRISLLEAEDAECSQGKLPIVACRPSAGGTTVENTAGGAVLLMLASQHHGTAKVRNPCLHSHLRPEQCSNSIKCHELSVSTPCGGPLPT